MLQFNNSRERAIFVVKLYSSEGETKTFVNLGFFGVSLYL